MCCSHLIGIIGSGNTGKLCQARGGTRTVWVVCLRRGGERVCMVKCYV